MDFSVYIALTTPNCEAYISDPMAFINVDMPLLLEDITNRLDDFLCSSNPEEPKLS